MQSPLTGYEPMGNNLHDPPPEYEPPQQPQIYEDVRPVMHVFKYLSSFFALFFYSGI